jgi:ParB family chromosome partitioning protein
MTWESFVNNRLPLLNLPQDITEALRQGQIAYTKAKAIAQSKMKPSELLCSRKRSRSNYLSAKLKKKSTRFNPNPNRKLQKFQTA